MEELLREYAAARSADLRNRIVEQNLNLARVVARRFSGRGVEYDDLFQVASLALVKAIERYEPDKGVKLASFAIPSIVGEVKNYFRDRSRVIRMPRRSGELLQAIERGRGELSQSLGRSPTAAELADALGAPLDDVLEALEAQSAISTPVSLDAPIEEDEGVELHGSLGELDAGFERFERRELVVALLTRLPDMERRVLEERFVRERSQRDVAAMLGVSQMTISRSERRALSVLKKMLSEE